MVAQNFFFGLLSLVMVVAAFRLVTTKNIVRAALFLAIVLAGAAGQFLLLAAEFELDGLGDLGIGFGQRVRKEAGKERKVRDGAHERLPGQKG